MVNPSKRRGTGWESDIVVYLKLHGWRYAERRALNGSQDRGDVAGIPGVVIEAKNVKAITLSAFIDEATHEAKNDGAGIGVAWIKRRGKASPADGYIVMDGATFVSMLHDAGYGGHNPKTNVASDTFTGGPRDAEYYQRHRDDPEEWGEAVSAS